MRSRFAWKIGMLGSMAVAIVVAAATVMRPVPAQALPIAPASQAPHLRRALDHDRAVALRFGSALE